MVLIDGPNGLCTIRDGKMVPIEAERVSLAMEGQKLFEYDATSGSLKLNREQAPEGMLEQISTMIQKSPKGIEVQFQFPFPLPGPNHLKGVRSVSYFTPEEAVAKKDSVDEMAFEELGKVYGNLREPLTQRIRNYLGRLFS